MQDWINLKSDAMNPPTEIMWEMMQWATPGWVMDRCDDNVRSLEEAGAALLGKEAAVFLPTGRVACLVALLTYAERGTQIVLERNSHLLWCQEWNYASIAGLAAHAVQGERGIPHADAVEAALTESRFGHRPVTSLLCLENTHTLAGGTCMTAETTHRLCDIAHAHGAKVFLDGARLLYAAAALSTEPAQLAEGADAVMITLAKGLGAPGGALLCGTYEAMDRAWEHARRLGVASFQFAGSLAAAGHVALDSMRAALAEDIAWARTLGSGLHEIPGVRVDVDAIETNIVLMDVAETGMSAADFIESMAALGIGAHRAADTLLRFTTHYRIRAKEVARTLEAVRRIVDQGPAHNGEPRS